MGHLLDNADPIHKITVIGRGQALGYTLSIPEEDRGLQSRNEMIDDMAMLLGGRVAEEIVIGDITTGASNDLERATKMARNMVTVFGMSDKLGHRVYGERQHNPFLGRDYSSTPDYSDTTADLIDAEVTRLMNDAHDTAYRILTENREQLELMASVLLERETVEGPAVEALLNNRWEEYLEAEAAGKVRQNGDLFGFEEEQEEPADNAALPASELPQPAAEQPRAQRQAGGPQPPEGY